MKAIIKENCRVSLNGYEVIDLIKDQQVEGELAKFCLERDLAKAAKEPAVKKSKSPAKKK